MKLLFIHDHVFRKVENDLYSTGNLSDDVLSRYANLVDSLDVVARIRTVDVFDGKWSKITNPKISISGCNRLFYSQLAKKIRNCDKMIVRLPSFLGIQALLLNKLYKKPVLIELVACANDALRFHGTSGKFIAPIMRFLTKNEVLHAKYVLYVTNRFLQNRYPTNGTSIGCSDVSLNEIEETVLENRIRHIEARENKIVIGTTGAINVRYKGQENVIKALSILKEKGYTNYVYELVGNGSEEYLKKVAEQNGVLNCVHFLGGKPHEEVFRWLDSIDVYIQPSLTEGLPRALVEAQSRALPCIGSEVGEIPVLINEHFVYPVTDEMPMMIADLLLNMSTQCMLEQAKVNFDIAHKYDRHLLDSQRNEFFLKFLAK